MRMSRAIKLDTTQIQFMMKHAREIGNFRDLQRLEKIRKFQDPNFRYPKRRRHYLNESFYERARKLNGFNRTVVDSE